MSAGRNPLDSYIIPEWPAPMPVRAVVTTRQCGNLASPDNRQQLPQNLGLIYPPVWLEQQHGARVIDLDRNPSALTGDAAYTRTVGRVCAILTADCLPLLITDRRGLLAAAIHAGWRGLSAGIIDATLDALQTPVSDLFVWLGPAIGPDHFEVGPEVRERFIARHIDYDHAFNPISNGKWLADIYRLAKINLQHRGVTHVYGGGFCTVCESDRFYSYRREKANAGRMVSLIWLQ